MPTTNRTGRRRRGLLDLVDIALALDLLPADGMRLMPAQPQDTADAGGGPGDHLTVSDEALTAYGRALEPKKLVLLPGGHFDAYVKGFDSASGPARDWFVQHLGRS